MIPLYDLQKLQRIPLATYLLISLNMLMFIGQLLLPDQEVALFFRTWGVIPQQVTTNFFDPSTLITFITSLFIHGNWLHLAGNMLFLLIFGDDIEDWLGSQWYLGFYVVCGIAAALAQVAISPNENRAMIGASGAISGLMGAYFILLPAIPIYGLSIRCLWTHRIDMFPAAVVTLVWFGYQLAYALASLNNLGQGGVAFFAHLGGFVAGAGLARWYLSRVGRPVPSFSFGRNSPFNRSQPFKATPPRRPSPEPPIIFPSPKKPSAPPPRPASPPRYEWQPEDEAAIQEEIEAIANEIRSAPRKTQPAPAVVIPLRRSAESAKADFSGLSGLDQRAQVMKFLNLHKGAVIDVETHKGLYYRGTVVVFNSKQVMLRDLTGKSVWIPLGDILHVWDNKDQVN